MHLRVLGCHGGESPTHRATAFCIDDKLLLDAGAATRGLTVAEQSKIDWVVLSHSHLDHVRDLALLADNVISVRPRPIEVYCTAPTADALERHIFNNVIWPDFTKIPNPADPNKQPLVKIVRVESGMSFAVGDYRIRTVAVHHPVDCQAILVTDKTGTLAYSGDTGPTMQLWAELNKLTDLRAFIYEVSFPDHLAGLAEISGHLTPSLLQGELRKLSVKSQPRILLYHIKPGFHDEMRAQLAALKDPRLVILKPMDELEI